jgi:O-phosphoseryl-tRNA(Cys) synthetase
MSHSRRSFRYSRDASKSREDNKNVEKEFDIIRQLFQRHQFLVADLITFRDIPDVAKTFNDASSLIDYLKQVRHSLSLSFNKKMNSSLIFKKSISKQSLSESFLILNLCVGGVFR